jgi:transcriptional regulator with XRE-family HTH domain
MRSKVAERMLANTPEDVKIFTSLYAALVVKVNRLLKEKGLTQKALAEKLDKNPSEIHKWLSGEHNFTLRSIAKLQAELGEPLIVVPSLPQRVEFVSGNTKTIQSYVSPKAIAVKKLKTKDWTNGTLQTKLANVG